MSADRAVGQQCLDSCRSSVAGKPSFTLIEMLVVVAIIGIILGILLPVLSKVRLYTHRTRMRDLVHQVETVWENYLQDYRKFPENIDFQQMNLQAMNIVTGYNAAYNPAGHTYMEFTTNEVKQGFLGDFWGRPIQIALDNGRSRGDSAAYDCRVNAGEHGTVYHYVAVWSKGERNGLNGKQDDPTDDIKSW